MNLHICFSAAFEPSIISKDNIPFISLIFFYYCRGNIAAFKIRTASSRMLSFCIRIIFFFFVPQNSKS